FLIVVGRAEIIIANAVVHAQLRRQLPGVLKKEVERIYIYDAFLLANGNGRKTYSAGNEVRQSQDVEIVIRRIDILEKSRSILKVGEPRPLRPVKQKPSQSMEMVELIHLRLPVFAPKPVLVLPHHVGECVRCVARNVDAPRGRAQTSLVKPENEEIWRSGERCAGTEVQAHGFRIKT